MQLQRRYLWMVILLVGVAVAAALVLLKPRPQPKPEAEPVPPQVPVVTIAPETMALSVASEGTVTPLREIDLVAEVAGRVTRVADNFVAGDFFAASAPLVYLDDANYQLALVRARARVADAVQLLATEKGRARQAQREWRDLGNPEANALFLREPQLAAAEAALASTEADLTQAQLDLAKTAIAAPFAGRIRETYVNLGQYVSPGTRVARVFDSQVVEVRLPLTDDQVALLDLHPGYRAAPDQGPQVVLTGQVAGERVQWRGRIARTDASLDTRTRMYHAVAEVRQADNPDVPLVVGLFVRAQISGKAIEQVIKVPRTALYKHDTVVYVDAENRAVFVTVDVLDSDDTYAWLQAPLPAGARIATGRQGYLRPGVGVQAVPHEQGERP